MLSSTANQDNRVKVFYSSSSMDCYIGGGWEGGEEEEGKEVKSFSFRVASLYEENFSFLPQQLLSQVYILTKLFFFYFYFHTQHRICRHTKA